VIAILLRDEQNVFMWLCQYGTLTKTQVVKLLRDKPPNIAGKIINNLKRQLLVTESSDGYYLSTDPPSRPDPRMITAIWVLLRFIDDVYPVEHYPSDYPAQICYPILIQCHFAQTAEKSPCFGLFSEYSNTLAATLEM